MSRPLPRAQLRAHFNSSPLVRFLTENAMMEPAQATEDVGHKLGDWLNFRQAITLQSVLQAGPHGKAPEIQPLPAHLRRAATISPAALANHVDKVRAQLAESITQGAPSGSGLALIQMPAAELDEPIDPKTAFAPYRRFHAAHQRQMENTLRSLRASVRLQLTQRGGHLQQLATLDAAFEDILSEREALLLGKVSKMLEKRFVQALKLHLKQHNEAVFDTDSPAGAPQQALSCLMPHRQALRTALLAELDTRLQPTLGLLEALTSETPDT
jgi:hypothetical protein